MSNFDDNNDKDDKKQNDPFEFFKLSSEPSKDGKNDKNNKKKLPVWLILTIAMVLLLVTVLGMFAGCGKTEEAQPDMSAVVDAAVKAALDAAVSPVVVTIEADGKHQMVYKHAISTIAPVRNVDLTEEGT